MMYGYISRSLCRIFYTVQFEIPKRNSIRLMDTYLVVLIIYFTFFMFSLGLFIIQRPEYTFNTVGNKLDAIKLITNMVNG